MSQRYSGHHALAPKQLAGALFVALALMLHPLVTVNAMADSTDAVFSGLSATVKPDQVYRSTGIDGSQYGDLTLSFEYDSSELDVNPHLDSFTYGWSAGGQDHQLGSTIYGLVGNSGDEQGSVLEPLPQEALVNDLTIFISVSANTNSDVIKVTNLTLRGTKNLSVTMTTAALSTTIPTTAAANEPVDFTSSIGDVSNADGVMVRVKTTFTGGDPENVVFEYQEFQDPSHPYYPLSHETGSGDFYFGSAAGFPLMDATSILRITFERAGSYTATSEIIDVADDSTIGLPVVRTVEVSDPIQNPRPVDTTAPAVVSASLGVIGSDNVTSARMNPDGKLALTITTDEEILDWKSQALLMRTTADGGAITLPRVHFVKIADNTYRAYFDLNGPSLAGAYTENLRLRFKLYDTMANATPWTYLRLGASGDYDDTAGIYRFTVNNAMSDQTAGNDQSEGDTPGQAPVSETNNEPEVASDPKNDMSVQIFTAPLPVLSSPGPLVTLDDSAPAQENQEAANSEEKEDTAVLGTKSKEGTRLSDTAVLGVEDKNNTLLGLSWLSWLGVATALTVGWLILAAIIRRIRGTEI